MKVYGDFIQSCSGCDLIFYSLCVLKSIETTCVQWEHNNEDWLMGLFAVCLRLGRVPATVCACCAPLHDVDWVTEGLNNPPLVHFLNPLISPPLALPKSSPRFSGEWKQVNYKIEFPGIWPVWLHPLIFFFFFFPTKRTHEREREKAKAGLSPPEYRPLCLFSPIENKPCFSHRRGTERREGRQN